MNSDQEFQKHHLPKACKFCGQAAGYAPLPETASLGISIYFCHPCLAEFIYWDKTGNPASSSLYTIINDKMYRWTIDAYSGAGLLYHVGEPGIPGVKANQKMVRVKTFFPDQGFVDPNITPQNIHDKIKTWLLFL